MRRIAVLNQKGGVGKTTSTVNLAAALAADGHRTLVLDLDPQAHATLHLGLLDARAAVVSASVEPPGESRDHPGLGETVHLEGCAILDLVVAQVSPAVRPDDVLTALGAVAGLDEPLTSRSTRLGQGRLDDTTGVLTDPLGPDRAAAARDGAPGET